MKKPSGTRVNIMIMGIVIVVLALGLAAILGYGKARKQMEQMQQAFSTLSFMPSSNPNPSGSARCPKRS